MSEEFLISKTRLPWRHLLVFGWMPSFLKCWCYRALLGYRIGRSVRLGLGAAVVGDDVDIEDHVSIGFFTIVRGPTIRIGRHTQIGATSYITCQRIEIGEDAKINEQVFVGGPMLPDSLFRLGSRTIVMQMSFLNPTRPLVIGDDSGIGGHCLLFTHGSWLNVLDGYPVTFEPITIGSSVWLPWRVFVMPGSTIGDGSVIGANSLVQGAVPPMSLAVGSPAKVIRSAPAFPAALDETQRQSLVQEMLASFNAFVQAHHVIQDGRSYRVGRRTYHLIWRQEPGPLPAALPPNPVIFTQVCLSPEEVARLRLEGVSWLDLGGRTRSRAGNALCEELALFLSRYGIRLVRDG